MIKTIEDNSLSVFELENLYEIVRAKLLKIPYSICGNPERMQETTLLVNEVHIDAVKSIMKKRNFRP